MHAVVLELSDSFQTYLTKFLGKLLSNRHMRQPNKYCMALLQVAAIGFFLNTAAAYGACNMMMSAPDSSTAERLPCHTADMGSTKSTDSNNESEFDNCCSSCVLVAVPNNSGFAAHPEHDLVRERIEPSPVVGGFDPPFRPPIISLS